MSDTRLPLQVVREYLVSQYSSKTEANIAWEALDRMDEALHKAIPWVASSPRGAAQEALAHACAVVGSDPWDWTAHRAVLRSRLALIAGGVSVSTLGDDELWQAAREALGA